jgi:hypothetical protein
MDLFYGVCMSYNLILASSKKTSNTTATFPYTSSLVHGNSAGASNNSTFLDSSTNNYSIALTGTAAQGSFTPYGACWSNYFNGSSYFTISSASALNFGTGNFTIECWINPSSQTSAQFLWDFYSSATCVYGLCTISGVLEWYNGSAYKSTGVSPAIGVWTHVAVVRSSGTTTIYVNGVSKISWADTVSYSAATPVAYLGCNYGAVDEFTGYISNLRVVTGTAVYTTNFTPTTSPLAVITNTSLLTCSSNRMVDVSNHLTLAATGAPAVQRFNPFGDNAVAYSTTAYGGSVLLNGSSYLSYASSNSLTSFTGPFTMECWIYPLTLSSSTGFELIYNWGSGIATTSSAIFNISGSYTVQLNYGIGSTNSAVTGTTAKVVANQWNHVAVTRDSSNVIRLFVNGVVDSTTATVSGTFNNSGEPLLVGAGSTSGGPTPNAYATGYLSDVRINSTTAVYTASFTPPTTPLTAISGTKLLLNCQNAGLVDYSMNHNLTYNGSAATSTTEAKFGTSSITIPSTTSYFGYSGYDQTLSIPASCPFTMECWIYIPSYAASSYYMVYGVDPTASGATQFGFGLNNGGISANTAMVGLDFFEGVSSSWQAHLYSGTLPPAGQWNHIAVSRDSSNNIRLFQNGVLQTSTLWQSGSSYSASEALPNSTSYPTKIGYLTVASTMYVQDFRLLNGYCAYTATFAVPASPFANS